MAAYIIVFIVVIALLLNFYFFPRALVVGNSMYPTYKDGEVIRVKRVFNKKKVKENQVVIVKFKVVEDDRHRVVIKRVTKFSDLYKEKRMFLEGDNPIESYDSRMYGYVPVKYILGVLIDQRDKKWKKN